MWEGGERWELRAWGPPAPLPLGSLQPLSQLLQLRMRRQRLSHPGVVHGHEAAGGDSQLYVVVPARSGARCVRKADLFLPTFHILHAPRRETKDQLFNRVRRINLKPHQIQSANKNCLNKRPGTEGGGGGLLATITSFHKTVYPHNLERHLKSLIPIGMKVPVPAGRWAVPSPVPALLGGRRIRGGHWERAETGQLQPECCLKAPSPPFSPSHPLFSPILKGSKMVTRFKAEASKMLHNREDKGGLGALLPNPQPTAVQPPGLGPLPGAAPPLGFGVSPTQC